MINNISSTTEGTPTSLREYIKFTGEMMGKHNKNAKKFYDWMLKNFEEMKIEKLKCKELKFVQKIIDEIKKLGHDNFPANKECFFNANLLSLFSKGKIKYIEGQCWSIIPLEHAWCKYKGIYFDPTAQWNGRFDERNQYMGVQISQLDLIKLGFEEKNSVMTPIIMKKFREDLKNENC